MRRPRLLVLGGGALFAAACAFPDLSFSDGGADGGDDVLAGDASSGDGGGGGVESGPDATGAGGDASDADGGAVAPETGSDAPVSCDQDKDTYFAEGGTCRGNDCCDTSFDTHPGQTKFFIKENACASFDYNCNGKDDPQYPISLTCGGAAATGCTGGSGYLKDPGCGNTAPYYTCTGNGLLACTPGQPIDQQQGCN
jgi:hypothetical protein